MRSAADVSMVLKPCVKLRYVSQKRLLFAGKKLPGCLAMVLVATSPLWLTKWRQRLRQPSKVPEVLFAPGISD